MITGVESAAIRIGIVREAETAAALIGSSSCGGSSRESSRADAAGSSSWGIEQQRVQLRGSCCSSEKQKLLRCKQ